jgi:hypothetical protein
VRADALLPHVHHGVAFRHVLNRGRCGEAGA